jgi:hypothetical protein
MLNNRPLILDTFCEVYELLQPWADDEFWDFGQHEIVPNAIYLIGRVQFNQNRDRIRQLVEENNLKVVLSNPAEGSDTLRHHCEYMHRVADLVKQRKILLIGGGDMDAEWPHLQYDSFLPKVFDYRENLHASARIGEIFDKKDKPFKFLFLNGRMRGHRKYLLERFDVNGLLDQAIWSNLESGSGARINIKFIHNGQDLMWSHRDAKMLDPYYEVDRYQSGLDQEYNEKFIKYKLFNDEWGEIYIKAEPYIDTYFSVVTETVFDYPYSFRTEKIWKPIVMGHPWIAASSMGYYRDIRSLGFKTFAHLIDESFDQIENSQDRLERIAEVVEDLVKQDLPAFLEAAKDTCKYNRQHYVDVRKQVRQEFPNRFANFINQYWPQ